jgi:hypothetical protein
MPHPSVVDTATTRGGKADRRPSAREYPGPVKQLLGSAKGLPGSLLVGGDVGLVYAAAVTALGLALTVLPDQVAARFVLDSSTNLVNLRQHPPFVLVVSAFVEPSVWQLWIVVPMVVVYGLIQRWLGRAAVVISAVLGHVGATLFVATILTAGIAHGRIALAQARATDVGVSYGLIAGLGLLAARVPQRWMPRYALGFSVALATALIVSRSFTSLGHLCAWTIGLALAVLVQRAQRLGDGPTGDLAILLQRAQRLGGGPTGDAIPGRPEVTGSRPEGDA